MSDKDLPRPTGDNPPTEFCGDKIGTVPPDSLYGQITRIIEQECFVTREIALFVAEEILLLVRQAVYPIPSSPPQAATRSEQGE